MLVSKFNDYNEFLSHYPHKSQRRTVCICEKPAVLTKQQYLPPGNENGLLAQATVQTWERSQSLQLTKG